MNMKIGLFIGRFQPFHNGHLAIIKQALKNVNHLKIVLGTKQESRTGKNPLTWEERKDIITQTLEAESISNYEIFALNDIPNDNEYPSYVKENVGNFDIVFSGENPLVKKLFTEAGHEVITSHRINNWIATEIRRKMRNDESIKDLVPGTTLKLLTEKYKEKIKLPLEQ